MDEAFVDGVAESDEDAVPVGTVIDLARGLGLTTVAEGIETTGQLASLRKLGCERGPGFHFARSLHADDAEDLARRHGPRGSRVAWDRSDGSRPRLAYSLKREVRTLRRLWP